MTCTHPKFTRSQFDWVCDFCYSPLMVCDDQGRLIEAEVGESMMSREYIAMLDEAAGIDPNNDV